jgi:hypothetical protein
MTADQIRHLAQADPVPILTARWGEISAEARRRVAALEDSLRELDQVTADLAGHDLHVATSLGATGDAARHAFQAGQADRDRPAFTLHGPGAA